MEKQRIFITTGSQKFQFNRLLSAVDQLYESGVLAASAFAQTGSSDYRPEHYDYKEFLDRDEFEAEINKADLVITHGGTGIIIGAVKKGKKVIAVPRLAKYGEHVDDHQLQLLEQFDEMGIILVCYDLGCLGECIRETEKQTFVPYRTNTMSILGSIEEFLEKGWQTK